MSLNSIDKNASIRKVVMSSFNEQRKVFDKYNSFLDIDGVKCRVLDLSWLKMKIFCNS